MEAGAARFEPFAGLAHVSLRTDGFNGDGWDSCSDVIRTQHRNDLLDARPEGFQPNSRSVT